MGWDPNLQHLSLEVHERFKLWLFPSPYSAQVLFHNYVGISSHIMYSTESWAVGIQESNYVLNFPLLTHMPTHPCPINVCGNIQWNVWKQFFLINYKVLHKWYCYHLFVCEHSDLTLYFKGVREFVFNYSTSSFILLPELTLAFFVV